MKKLILLIVLVLVLAVGVLLGRTAQLKPVPPLAEAIPPMPLDEAALAARLAQAIRIPTLSITGAPVEEGGGTAETFVQLHALLQSLYPTVHRELTLETVSEHSLLLRWDGSDPSLKPMLLAAHQDVVPIEPGTEGKWTHAPFSGAIAEGYVWGRGALDDKSCLMGIMESVEGLLTQGFQPQRTVYLAFGHDEEIGGTAGAVEIANTLRERGIEFAFTLDEGSAVTKGIIDGIDKPVAAIMAGEKGYITFKLTLRGQGGHSSTPTPNGVIPRMSAAVAKLEANPLPARLTPPVETMLERVAPEMPFSARLAIANRDVLGPVLMGVLGSSPITNALIRSTQAITVFRSGVKDNVLPSEATVLINYRLLPGDTIEGVRQHIIETIGDDAIEVGTTEEFGNEAPALSDPDAPEFGIIARTVNQVFPDAIVSSGIILATTDNRHYAGLRDQAYYFAPFVYTGDDQSRIHGTDERIGVADYANMVRFYTQLIRNSGAP